MCCWAWLRVRAAFKSLKRAKVNAYRQSLGLKTIERSSKLKVCLSWIFCFCLKWKIRGTNTRALDYICQDGTLANRVVKGVFRFLCGFICVALLLFTLKKKLQVTLSYEVLVATGILSGVGLAVFQTFRLVCLLIAPQVFAKSVRVILLAKAGFYALNGSGKNFRCNLDSLLIGLHKCKEDLKTSLQDIKSEIIHPLELIANFVMDLEDSLEVTLKTVKDLIEPLQSSLGVLEQVMEDSYNWLKDITDLCNNDFDTPYNRCKIQFKEAAASCVDTLGESLAFMCHVDALDGLCETTKFVQGLCIYPPFFGENVVMLSKRVGLDLENILQSWTEFFDVHVENITFNRPQSNLNFSKDPKDIFKDIRNEIFQNLDWFLRWQVSIPDMLTIAVILFMIGSAVNYLYWYLHSEQHDNKYITTGMIRMDLQRRSLGRPGIFPLLYNESPEYVQVWTFRKLKEEKRQFKRQVLMVVITTVPILIYVFLDVTLYLFLIQIGGDEFNRDEQTTAFPGSTDEQDDAWKKFSKQLNVVFTLDIAQCIASEPKKPNFHQIALICFILLFCITSAAFEAYSTRIRHVICAMHYPSQQRERDRWLYLHILNSRDTFFKYARVQIMARLTGDDKVYHVGILQRLIHQVPCCGRLLWFCSVSQKQCFLCGRAGPLDDYENFQHCPVCESVYCHPCFEELKSCPACSTQVEVDVEIDEESGSTDSSDEDQQITPKESGKGFGGIMASTLRKQPSALGILGKYTRLSHGSESTETSLEEDEHSTSSDNDHTPLLSQKPYHSKEGHDTSVNELQYSSRRPLTHQQSAEQTDKSTNSKRQDESRRPPQQAQDTESDLHFLGTRERTAASTKHSEAVWREGSAPVPTSLDPQSPDNFWNFDRGARNSHDETTSSFSELEKARLSPEEVLSFKEVGSEVYGKYSQVLTDLSASYIQFETMSSDDLPTMSSVLGPSELISGHSRYRRNENQSKPERISPSVISDKDASDFDSEVDERCKMHYHQMLTELVTDYPEFLTHDDDSETYFS